MTSPVAADVIDVYSNDASDSEDSQPGSSSRPRDAASTAAKASSSYIAPKGRQQQQSQPSASASFSVRDSHHAAVAAAARSAQQISSPSSARSSGSSSASSSHSSSFSRFSSFFRAPSSSSPSSPSGSFSATSVSEGGEVLKLDRHGVMKRRHLTLGEDEEGRAVLSWDSERRKAHKAFMLLDECRLECGCEQGFFHVIKGRERAKLQPSHCFSLLGEKRSLDVVCRTQAEANSWIAALSPLLPPASALPACAGRFLRSITTSLPCSPLSRPQGLSISPITGELFVCNTGASTVLLFDRASACKAVWGRPGGGSDDLGFDHPTAVGVSYEEAWVYVCDAGNRRVQVLDVRGKLRESWQDKRLHEDCGGESSQPAQCTVSPHTNLLYIADQTTLQVQIYTAEGDHVGSITPRAEQTAASSPVSSSSSSASSAPRASFRIGGIAVWGEAGRDRRLYLVNSSAHRVEVYSAGDGEDGRRLGQWLFSFGRKGAGKGQMFTPKGIAVDHGHGQLVLADSDNHRLQCFDMEGGWLAEWGREGPDAGEFSKPTGVALCPLTGLLYVSDCNNNRIQVFY